MITVKHMLRNVVYEYDDVRFNTLSHLFLYITFIIGLLFTFFPGVTGAVASLLYSQTAMLWVYSPSLWGIMALSAGVLCWLGTALRRKWLAEIACMLGFSVWVFALIVYVYSGAWLWVFVTALPNALFWVWQYLHTKAYYRVFKQGLIPTHR